MFRRALALLLALVVTARAHDGLDLGEPLSPQDAWSVLKLCNRNIGELIAGQQWIEISIQASLCNRAARYLRKQSGEAEAEAQLRLHLQDLQNAAVFLVRSALQTNIPKIKSDAESFGVLLSAVEKRYDPKITTAPVFSCPMCKGIRELDVKTPCFKCGMALVPRVIPASSLYNTPGQPSIALKPTLARPLTVGKPCEVKLAFTRKKDGAPVTHDDLLILHTERIHLLIIDESLTDYHHEHPVPTATPGEFAFTFTPRQPGPYRVFADVVPRLSNVQEYPVCDLPAATKGKAISDRATVSSRDVDGLRYELQWETGGLPVQVQKPVNASITVTRKDGQPFDQLEPIMGAYAHLVGFHEDRATVLHLHPLGAEPQQPADRGGPSLHFRFYAPKAGFIRFYGQVQIGGKSVFIPFGLNVEP